MVNQLKITSWYRVLIRGLGYTLALVIAYLLLLCFPYFFFDYSIKYENIELFSDKEIPEEGYEVLEDTFNRINKSYFYKAKDTYRVFICNNENTFKLFANINYGVGGINYVYFNQNSFLRSALIERNRLLKSSGKVVLGERTLSYFIAHEITHGMTARFLGRYRYQRLPTWLKEGYADYIGKPFYLKRDFKKFLRNDIEMIPELSGLYLRYQLRVLYLLDYVKMSTLDIFLNELNVRVIEKDLRKLKI